MTRRRAVPSGTVGGRTAGTKKPRSARFWAQGYRGLVRPDDQGEDRALVVGKGMGQGETGEGVAQGPDAVGEDGAPAVAFVQRGRGPRRRSAAAATGGGRAVV